MKILYYNMSFYNNDGAGIHAREFYNAAQKTDVDISVFPGRPDKDGKISFKQNVKSVIKNFKSFIYKFLPEDRQILYSFSKGGIGCFTELKEHLKTNTYDWILHRNTLSIWQIKALKDLGYKLALEINASIVDETFRHVKGSERLLLQEVQSWQYADKIICVSDYLKKWVIEKGLKKEKVVSVFNGINTNIFKNIKSKTNREIFSIGYIGSFQKYHKLERLIDSIYEIDSINDLQVILVGDGPTKKDLERKVKDLGLTDIVHFRGKVPHEEIPKIISSFNVGTLPDNLLHGSPQKVVEYLASGIPVIISNNILLPQDFLEKEHICIYDLNEKSLTQAILEVYNNNEALIKSAQTDRENIINRFSWNYAAEKIINFIVE